MTFSLIALSISAADSNDAKNALAQLPKLKGCQAHTSVLLSQVDILEFRKIAGRKLQFNVELNGENPAQVYSPWYDSGGNLLEPGSYFYNGNWERIDHFFAGSGVSLCDFKVENKGSWANADGTPAKYIVKYGSGYSDHFPVSCVVTW